MIDIYDFIGFAKSQGFSVSYRAKVGECLIFDISKSPGRNLATRVDTSNPKITWFVNDYDISKIDLESLITSYLEGLNEGTNNI